MINVKTENFPHKMANLVVQDRLSTNLQETSRDPTTNQGMNPDFSNLKKRKFVTTAAEEESDLPSPKHRCCEPSSIGSEHDSSVLKAQEGGSITTEPADDHMELLNAPLESGQDSNSFHGDSRLSVEANSYEQASTSWFDNSLVSSETRILSFTGDDSNKEEESMLARGEQCSRLDTTWHDADCLEECISGEHLKGNSQQTAERLEEFLASIPERWSTDQEVQQVRRSKPTIDQEFEQYFSTLML